MSFRAYILLCADNSYYTGHTDNLETRVVAHERGEIPGYTFTRRLVHLAFAQDVPTRAEAISAERQIKGWGQRKKEALIKGEWERLPELAKSSFGTRKVITKQGHPSTSSGRTE
ncbi:MAG: GIY-YIG nuclease family protein [Dehalococcoidia bacterium]|nr:GIY-YIG nuclease family protein [Dehalococcoidia bacterium]